VLGAAAEGEEQELINYGVLGGIVTGLVAAVLWQRFYRIKLPPTWPSSVAGGSSRSSPRSP
jgi:PTS system N-acetylglucosamine-specific IIC component